MAVQGRFTTMYEDYEDYEDFLDNPPRLITCPAAENGTSAPGDVGGPSRSRRIECVSPFLLDGRRQTVAIYGVVRPTRTDSHTRCA